jgi:hypothetical protein
MAGSNWGNVMSWAEGVYIYISLRRVSLQVMLKVQGFGGRIRLVSVPVHTSIPALRDGERRLN